MNPIPSVSRKVWYYDGHGGNNGQPMDATIIKVHASPELATPDTYVNLRVTNPDTGEPFTLASVKVGDENTPFPHFRWMPYQQAQAAAQAAAAA